ncbi:MAG: hypothetical protein ACJZ40_05805 [Candidatus Poseidoniaceae archaeon]
MRSVVFLCMLLVCSGSFLSEVLAEEIEEGPQGATIDVLTLDQACIQAEDCEPIRPDHFVEYFGADWCEPCKVLDADLDELVDNETFVLRHHPSPQDLTYNTDSNQRFNRMYRLLFLPSLIHNGEDLLTGTSQAQDLGAIMSNSTTQFEGLTEVAVNNHTLTWNTSIHGTVTVWRTADVAHETEDYIHRNMVIDAAHFNASDGAGNISHLLELNGTGVVVMLETDGVRNLAVNSPNPAMGFDLNEQDDSPADAPAPRSSQIALVTTLVLLLLLAPALVMWKNAVTSVSLDNEDE